MRSGISVYKKKITIILRYYTVQYGTVPVVIKKIMDRLKNISSSEDLKSNLGLIFQMCFLDIPIKTEYSTSTIVLYDCRTC